MGKPKDPIWNHAIDLKGQRFQCKYCFKKFPGGATRIKAHLAGKKRCGIATCEMVPKDVSLAIVAPTDKTLASTSTTITNSLLDTEYWLHPDNDLLNNENLMLIDNDLLNNENLMLIDNDLLNIENWLLDDNDPPNPGNGDSLWLDSLLFDDDCITENLMFTENDLLNYENWLLDDNDPPNPGNVDDTQT
ncbi:putative disease resistance RPP13-like protein 1 [Fagus crenata]